MLINFASERLPHILPRVTLFCLSRMFALLQVRQVCNPTQIVYNVGVLPING